MMTFFITMFTALLIFLGGVLGLYHGLSYEEDTFLDKGFIEESGDAERPHGVPGQSAPPEAVRACNIKQAGDTCTFTFSQKDLQGLCIPSGKELACTPVLLK